ncbi:hypothetical protein KR100_06715 [Synechococcus sp. KORDI-100]|uniref:alpha-ketoglutarate-dependent dioxygenase AlkB family protein n=1 Tax=Synechococcus sp. KORDI-100 TaxID=1280380 RepID=UPI0004E0831F|nr:alpha-ketoglutarate-dependent dioxygenase AlkB [Synechococcus sp. KORDI-100]AII43056.1 hypothetical protein KR100_06715 [Synechococcus sp. KORDI-100]
MSWLPADEARWWRIRLMEQIDWQQPIVTLYGRRHPVPRMTSFLAADGLSYRYSGTVHQGTGWPEWFIPLLLKVSAASGTRFNGCLLNLYRSGDDRMGWHADDEPEINQAEPIASLSLGASRDFCLRLKQEAKEKHTLPLNDGDLLIMHPGCQQAWMHGVPTRRKISTSRINLTFRRFLINASNAGNK